MKYIIPFVYLSLLIASSLLSCAQKINPSGTILSQDSLRGSITPERAWWNVISYNIYVAPDYNAKTISGWNKIEFNVINDGANKKMQIDLQEPMKIDSIIFNQTRLTNYKRNGNVYIIDFGNHKFGSSDMMSHNGSNIFSYDVVIYYSGKAREAINPPWDGGWIWKKDEKGRPWMSVACQGLGASVWYPCKDHQSDEPDNGATIQISVPDTLVAVANGRLIAHDKQKNGTILYSWRVTSPINNYNIVPYIGKYVHWSDNFIGETEKKLSLDYWVIDYELEKAKKQFDANVKPMMKAFEYWFGPFPFYEDGYKLVQSPHLGMEHQSAVAYGNKFMNGYLGRDLSGSGWGLKWDFIIIHESGHEWFANNITTNDIADMWVHEGFTNYSETLFTEYHYGKEAADAYLQGIRKNIRNDKPIIGVYGINNEGSGDMYSKGANMLHTIRQVINNDSVFRGILRGLNKEYYHRTVNSKDIEDYFSKVSGKDLSKIFDQYLRTINIPQLEYKTKGNKISYRWANCIDGFNMPIDIGSDKSFRLYPSAAWEEIELPLNYKMDDVNKNFYIKTKKVE